ncbi:MAG: hypothetical protein PHR25_06365 [Clostridia bacterium]|nr:hypothetical protein [Clostridia bacterium]MDD4376381.1 hypothetical protein [Clostridia bacterium]
MCSRFKCPLCGSLLSTFDESNIRCTSLNCRFESNFLEVVDISYKDGLGATKGLSNLAPYKFTFDGVKCASFESFLQSLRVKDPKMQIEICSFPALFCYNIRFDLNDWRKDKLVYWNGIEIPRLSSKYSSLIYSAYDALFMQSYTFRYLLQLTKGKCLLHSIGCILKTETLLTPEEYLGNLERLRNLL